MEQRRQFRTAEDLRAAEIDQLRGELAHQRTADVSSIAEVERLRSEITALQEQCAQSELSCVQLEENWQQAVALNLELKARLQAKEDEFRAAEPNAQEQKEAGNIEHRLRSELDWLIREDKERNQMGLQKAELSQKEWNLEERVIDSAHPSNQHWNQARRSRRWNTGFAWKRRWKS